jgi:uncharacterized protein (DUF305 family)
MHRTLVAPVAVATLLLLLFVSGCGGGTEEQDEVVGKGPLRRNTADVTFATQMIPHHAQAVAMANLTLGRPVNPQLAATAEQMLTSSSETSKLQMLLQRWDEPIPRTMIDHVGHSMGDTSMPGALSKAEFHQLEQAQGPQFERAWLDAMIAHHEGALEMARSEQGEGASPVAKRLAAQMIQRQQAELQQLRQLQG